MLGICACNRENKIDTRLIGIWMDENLEYFHLDTLIGYGAAESKYKFQLNGFLGTPIQKGKRLDLKLVSGYYLRYEIIKQTEDSLWLITKDEQTKKVHNTNFVIANSDGTYESNRKDYKPFNDTIKFYNTKLLLNQNFEFKGLCYYSSTLSFDEKDTITKYVEINRKGDVYGRFSKSNLVKNQYKYIHLDSSEIKKLKEKILLCNLLNQNDKLMNPFIKISIFYSDTIKKISWANGGIPIYSLEFLDLHNNIMTKVYESDSLVIRKDEQF